MLKLASMGVRRTYLHSTPNRMFAVFQPGWGFTNGTGITQPHIMPMYNGLLVVSEMIGDSGNARAAEIENNSPSLASYGAWENEGLTRLVLVNSDTFLSGIRDSYVSLLSGPDTACTMVKRLRIPQTTSTERM